MGGTTGCLQGLLSPKMFQRAKTLVLTAGVVTLGAVASLVFGYVMASPTFGWTGQRPKPACKACQLGHVRT